MSDNAQNKYLEHVLLMIRKTEETKTSPPHMVCTVLTSQDSNP